MEQKCIAIFEDDEDILDVTKRILSQEYERVVAFSRCHNLMEDIERIKPDLILLDLRMPGINCEHAFKLLGKSDKTKDLPVILFSAVKDVGSVAKRTGATAILEKPFSIENLRNTVRKYISQEN